VASQEMTIVKALAAGDSSSSSIASPADVQWLTSEWSAVFSHRLVVVQRYRTLWRFHAKCFRPTIQLMKRNHTVPFE